MVCVCVSFFFFFFWGGGGRGGDHTRGTRPMILSIHADIMCSFAWFVTFETGCCIDVNILSFIYPICYTMELWPSETRNHKPLEWSHNGRDGVSNHQPCDCLLNRLFRRRSMKISKLRVTGLCEGNSPVTGEFPSQRAINAENISIWWRHHVYTASSFLRKCPFTIVLRRITTETL